MENKNIKNPEQRKKELLKRFPIILYRLSHLFFIIAAVLLIISLFSYLKTKKFSMWAIRTEGRIISVEKQNSDTSSSFYIVQVRYMTENNNVQYFKEHLDKNISKYEVGDKVPVIYDPKNPEKARIGIFSVLYLVKIVLLGISLSIVILGFVIRKFSNKMKNAIEKGHF